MASLEELAARTAGGDKNAFGAIYEALLDPIFKYLYWNLGSNEDAEDLAEEVFLRCLVNIATYNPKRGSFKSWAFRIAHNALVDYRRRKARRPQERLEEDMTDNVLPAADKLEEKETAIAMRDALDELKPAQRQVIIMKFFSQMSNAEVAKALGRSEGAVNAMQHRALRRMGKLLEERGWSE